jgi:hypothetical protein
MMHRRRHRDNVVPMSSREPRRVPAPTVLSKQATITGPNATSPGRPDEPGTTRSAGGLFAWPTP